MSIGRTFEELKAESKTLWYEFVQLSGVVDRLLECNFRHPDDVVHNALVESFAIHCRALCFFFFAGRSPFTGEKSDVLTARNFIQSWDTLRGEPAPILCTAKTDCDKQVAHITRIRRDLNFAGGPEHRWQMTQLIKCLQDILLCFLEKLPSNCFDNDALAHLRKLAQDERFGSLRFTGSSSAVCSAATLAPCIDYSEKRKWMGGVTD